MRRVGIETSNLYTAFLGLAILLLEPGGELVAITPRSFCNGPYFRPFRELFFREMSLRRVHVVDAPGTAGLWMPAGTYVLVKRLTSREEPRRVVAAVFEPETVPGE